MNQIKDIELSSSSFGGLPFIETNHFCNSYNENIFSKKLAEMKRNSSPQNRFAQNNEANNDEDYDEFDNETPRKNSNNVLTKNFFSPRSTKMLKDYTISEKIRIKWLRSIRDYVKLQEMQVVYNYLKTANVKILIRGLRLRKCFTLWNLKYQESILQNKWKNFATSLVRKQRTERFNKDASKARRTRAELIKISTKKEGNNSEGPYNFNEKLEGFAGQTVNNMLQPILSLKPVEKQEPNENESQSKSSHHRHHRSKQQSEENSEPIKTRDLNIEDIAENKVEKVIKNEVENENEIRDKDISKLTREKEALERRIRNCEKREKEQEQLIKRLIYLFIIVIAVLVLIAIIIGIKIGKSIKSTDQKLNTFVNSQTAITQELTAEISDFRVALTKIANLNKTVVPNP